MALTQISTGGVKDDAVTAGKIPANAIGSSEIADDAVDQGAIADEAVDEARLQISNAGTNGQFLQKQSGNTGGLTWADANQYTHPNHSGEVTSTADGAQVIADNVVDEANLKVSNSPTNGQLLSAQSGNTGGLTWTDPPASAPQIEATADGDITAGDTCIVNANGTVKKVTATYTEKTAVLGDYTSIVDGYNKEYIKVSFDSTRGQPIFLYKSQNGTSARLVTGNIANGDLTLNTEGEAETSINEIQGLAWSKTSSVGVALYRQGHSGNAVTYAEAFTSDGSSLTFGTKLAIADSSDASDAAISWDASADKFLVVVGRSTEGTGTTADAYVVSHSGTTLSKGTRVEVDSSEYRVGGLAYDDDNNKHIWTYRDNADSGKLAARIITVSGTTPTAGSEVVSDSSDVDGNRPVYISNGKFVVVYTKSSNTYARVITVSGTTPSFGTESSSIAATDASANQHGIAPTYDRTGKVIVGQLIGSNNAAFRILTIDTSNNTISAISSSTAIGTGKGSIDAYYDPDTQMHIFGGQKSDSHGYYRTAVTSDVSTNATTENYIGIAAGTVSSGATATIDVSGATNSSQSSLTAGQKYYVKKDGSLSLTADTPAVFAGTAIAATKLIVNDQQPIVDVGMWKLIRGVDIDSASGNEYDIFTDFASHSDKKWWKLVFRIESPDDDFSGSGIRVKVGGNWKTSSYDFTQFYVESTNEVGQRLDNQSRFSFTNRDEKWHAGEIMFYDPNATDIYKIFDFHGYAADHAWQASSDHPNITRAVGGYVGGLGAIQGIRFWKYSGNFGKIHFGLFASNGW